MSMINYMLNGVEPTINSNGTAIESNDFTWKFARNGSRCIKVHVPWEEDAFTNAKNRKIIWLTNPDTTIWAKKRLLKVALKYEGPIEAPIKKNEIVGKFRVIYDDELVGEYDLLAANNVDKVNIFTRLIKSLNFLIWGDV